MAKEYILGQTIENMRANGEEIKCTVKVLLLGPMEESMLVNMLMIRKKDMENLYGPMADAIEVNGLMESNMVKVHTLQARGMRSMANGKMVKESDGLVEANKNDR